MIEKHNVDDIQELYEACLKDIKTNQLHLKANKYYGNRSNIKICESKHITLLKEKEKIEKDYPEYLI